MEEDSVPTVPEGPSEDEVYVVWPLSVLALSVIVMAVLKVTKVVGGPVEDVSGLVLLALDVEVPGVPRPFVLLLDPSDTEDLDQGELEVVPVAPPVTEVCGKDVLSVP